MFFFLCLIKGGIHYLSTAPMLLHWGFFLPLQYTKKSILMKAFILFFACALCMAQADTTRWVYCEIIGTVKVNGKMHVVVDVGEPRKAFAKPADVREYNSMVDAINDMAQEGWDFVSSYNTAANAMQSVHFLLRRKEAE